MKKQLFKMKAIVCLFMGMVAVTGLNSCNSDGDEEPSSHEWSEQVVGQVQDQVGKVNYDSNNSCWTISSHTVGTIDETFVYYPVNLPDSLKEDNLSVRFSGDYADINITPRIGGQKYYKLRITAIYKVE